MTLREAMVKTQHIEIEAGGVLIDAESWYWDDGNLVVTYDDDGNDGRLHITPGELDSELSGHRIGIDDGEGNIYTLYLYRLQPIHHCDF